MNKTINLINRVDKDDMQEFLKNTKSSTSLITKGKIVTSDTSWIDMVEETIPYLDSIIRNPRRFIVQEENIVPIEKTKVVTEESIKHLAQHTSLIQDVDEDGNVVPLKLLNVYREETIDLYENRFIKSLIDNLYMFVNNKLQESEDIGEGNLNSKLEYEGNTKYNNEDVKIKLELESNGKGSSNNEMDDKVRTRIENIKSIVNAYHSSKFIKGLKGCVPVRSPIRKTNVILKEQNFKKALELWEYLEKNEIKPFTITKDINEERHDKEVLDIYNTSYYLNNLFLKHLNNNDIKGNLGLSEVINDYVYTENCTEEELLKIINDEVKKAFEEKQKLIDEIEKTVQDALHNCQNRFDEAIKILN